MLTCDLTYTLNRGSVPYTYGEDGLDSYEDTETILKATGTGETEPEALRNALADLPTALNAVLAGLRDFHTENEVRIEETAIRHAITTIHNPNWQWDSVSWVSPVATVPQGLTRWEVFTYDEEDEDAVDYDEPNTITHTLLTGGLNA